MPTGTRELVKGTARFVVATGDERYDRFWDWYASPTWEPDTVAAFESMITRDTVVIDFGAWIGPTTLLAAVRARRVVAIEPDPVAREMLERNLALNPHLARKVVVHGFAIGERDGTAILVSPGGGDSLSHLADRGAPGEQSWEVPTRTMATVLDLPEAAGAAFLKLDIEGGEYLGLASVAGRLLRERPDVYVSTHPNLLYVRRPLRTRLRSALTVLRANHRLLRTVMRYRHHYAWKDGMFVDVRRRSWVRLLLPLPVRSSLLVGSFLFTDRTLPASEDRVTIADPVEREVGPIPTESSKDLR